MTNIYNAKRKTDRKTTVPQSDLQILSSAVKFAINFRIQTCHIPQVLHASARAWELSRQITDLQAELKDSLNHDYKRQRSNILSKREANK